MTVGSTRLVEGVLVVRTCLSNTEEYTSLERRALHDGETMRYFADVIRLLGCFGRWSVFG